MAEIFCDHALYSSGDRHNFPPRSANVFRKLCGLKYGSLATANASLNIVPDRAGAAPVLAVQPGRGEAEDRHPL